MDNKTNTIGFSGLSSLVAGTGVGIYGTGSYVITNIICPACIIVTPMLLGYGFYKYKKGDKE